MEKDLKNHIYTLQKEQVGINMTKFDIEKYAPYFHDGIVFDLKHEKNKCYINIEMESAELRPAWNQDNIILSKRRTISGRLHLEKINFIKINGKLCHDELVKSYDEGNIYHLDIRNMNLKLEVSWENCPPKLKEETDVFAIEIEAEKIYWENIPTLFDAHWNSL